MRGLTRTQIEVEFQPLGLRRLKGVPEPVACYRVVPRGTAGAEAAPSSGGPPVWPAPAFSLSASRPWWSLPSGRAHSSWEAPGPPRPQVPQPPGPQARWT